jgi:hypothetical protein
MAKLMVRGYRPTSSQDGNGFALVNATSDISVVQEWIEKTPEGLLLHTGFEHLHGDIIRHLIPIVRGSLVVCAASRILIADSLPGKAWVMIAGNEANHIQLRSMGEWFFVAADSGDYEDTYVNSLLLGVDPAVDVASTGISIRSDFDTCGSERISELGRRDPEAILVLKDAGINNDRDFLTREHEFLTRYRIGYAEISFSFASIEAALQYTSSKTVLELAACVLTLARSVPTWMLNSLPFISTRLRSAFSQGNIDCLGTLASLSAEELVGLPLIGRKSMGELFSYLQNDLMLFARAVLIERSGVDVSVVASGLRESHPDASIKSLGLAIEAACLKAEQANARQGFVLRERVKGRPLDDIASELNLTRERVRQISVKALRQFSQGIRTPDVARLESLFDALYSSECVHDESFDVFFSAVDIHSAHNKAVLRTMDTMLQFVSFHLGVVKVAGIERTLPFPNALRSLTDEGLDSVIDEVALSIHSCTVDEAHLIANGKLAKVGLPPFLATFFARDIAKFRMYQSPDGTVTGQPMSASLRHQKILEFFRSQEEPINWHGEGLPFIQRQFPHPDGSARYADNDVADIRRNTLSSSDDYLFPLGYGDYGLWKHVPFTDEQAVIIGRFISIYLSQNANRQFTDKDLLSVLKANGLVSFGSSDRRNKHYISAALFRTRLEDVRYLGRFTWCAGSWTDEPDTESRMFISDILSEAIRDKGRPMLQKELRDAVIAVRGHGTEFFQVIEKDGIVKLTSSPDGNLYWDTALDPYPILSEEARQIQSELLEHLRKTSQMSIPTLKASLSKTSDWVASYNDAEFFALALRVPDVTIKNTSSGLSLIYSPFPLSEADV